MYWGGSVVRNSLADAGDSGAGPNGWTVLWADGGSSWKDEENTAEENFNTALKVAEEAVGTLTEVTLPVAYNVVEAGETCDEDESDGECCEG